MDIHASPASLPELEEFLATFQVRFRRPDGEAALERSLTGLLTELPHKNCDMMAEAVAGTSEQRLQEFLTNRPWDEDDLNRQRVEKMIAEAPVGQGVLLCDETGFAKQGKASVGVARQHCGTLGKVGNCQVGVTCCDSDPQARCPVAGRLSLPQEWTDAPERLRRAWVPAEVTCQTKPQIHSDAGLELSALAGVAVTPEAPKPGSPTRPFFPLGQIAGVVRCQQCIGR